MPNTTNQKLSALILYVARRCQMDDLFGMVKLNKILFYADFNAFRSMGRSITGATYTKRIFGPVPQGMDEIIAELTASGAAVMQYREMTDLMTQRRVIPLKPIDFTPLSGSEIAIVEEVIEWMRPMAAREVSELSHETAAWQITRMDEVIPYGMALVPASPLPLTTNEMKQAEQVMRRHAAS